MISRMITLPELGMISGTRQAFGAGLGLLLADRLNDEQRRAVGWTLVAVGAISSIPLFAEVMSRRHAVEQPTGRSRSRPISASAVFDEREAELIGS